jgi:hypothetical protein
MDSDVGVEVGKPGASGKSRGAQGATQEIVEVIREVTIALHRWYWSRKNNLTRDEAVRPGIDVLEYVYKARKEGLDKRSETAYCGSILLYSVLSLTGRRHTSDVDEANELFEVGRKLASTIWNELDGLRSTRRGVKDPDGLDASYTDISGKISDGLWNEYQKMKGAGEAGDRNSGGGIK